MKCPLYRDLKILVSILIVLTSTHIALSIYKFNTSLKDVNTTSIVENIERPDSPVSYNAMAELINIKRSENGVRPALTGSKALNASAQLKADDMAKKDYWSHNDPQGNEPWTFFDKVGYKYKRAGENLAKCYYTPQAVVDAWYASPEHKANILGDYKEIGFGYATMKNGCLLIVNHFGKR